MGQIINRLLLKSTGKIPIGLFCLFVYVGSSIAIEPQNIFENMPAEDNPDFSYILSTYQDSEDYIWIGTYNGLFRYDGVNYTKYVFSSDTASISNSVVHAIAEDSERNLWIGTEYGLNKYNRETGVFTSYFKEQDNDNSLGHDHVRSIYIDNYGFIWLGTYGGGVNRFNPKTSEFIRINEENTEGFDRGNRVNCFMAENDSTFWIGTESGGVYVINAKTFGVKPFKLADDKKYIIADIFKDSDNNIWFGTWLEGVFTFSPIDSTLVKPLQHLGQKWTAKSIVEDNEGALWIGTTDRGLVKYNRKTEAYVQYLPNDNLNGSILSNNVWNVFIDKSQIVWAGTFGNGFSRYDRYRHKFNNYTTVGIYDNGLSNSLVNVLFEYQDALWVGTKDGLNKFIVNEGKVTDYYLTDMDIAVSGIVNANKYLWLATNNGLYRFNLETNEVALCLDINNYPNIREDYITALAVDSDGDLWFAIYDEGLFFVPKEELGKPSMDLAKVKQFKHSETNKNTISANIIWDIHITSDNTLWLGTNTGIDRYKKESNKFDYIGGYAHSCFYSNQPGVLWGGSLGRGLVKIEMASLSITSYNSAKGLASDIVQAIEGDNEGNLWISTNKGISKFNPFNETIRNFDQADGISSVKYGLNSSCKLKSGQLVFGNGKGVTLFHPRDISDSPYEVSVKISDIIVLNKSIFSENTVESSEIEYSYLSDGSIDLKLNYSDNVITFAYSALCFSAAEKVQYSYMLEGFDDDWTYTRGEFQTATYTNLDGGKYKFKVKASNPDGVWGDDIAYIYLTVVPPFWKTIAFKVLIVILLVLVVVYIIFASNNRLKNKYILEKHRREKELMKLNNEKLDAELEYKKKELALSTLYSIKKNEDLLHLQKELVLISEHVIPKNRNRINNLIKEIEVSLTENESWAHFEQNFNILHDDFLKRFSQKYTKLTNKDLKVCAFIRMNIDNKEIARTLNITPESLGVSRTRIRKKINLDKEVFLNDFILRF